MVTPLSTAVARPVHESPYHSVRRHEGYLSMVRSGEPYPDLASIEAEYEVLVEALTIYKARKLALLVDLREAKGRNDPGFEETLEKWRRRALEGHDPLVVLVKSELGRMHVERHMKADGLTAIVTTEEAHAVRAVQGRPSGVLPQQRP